MKIAQKIAAISPDEWQAVAQRHVSYLYPFPGTIIKTDLLKGRHWLCTSDQEPHPVSQCSGHCKRQAVSAPFHRPYGHQSL